MINWIRVGKLKVQGAYTDTSEGRWYCKRLGQASRTVAYVVKLDGVRQGPIHETLAHAKSWTEQEIERRSRTQPGTGSLGMPAPMSK